MLMHAPSGAEGSEQRFALTPGRSVAEVRLVTAMMGAVDVAQGTPVADFELLDADGNVVARDQLLAGRGVMEWSWDQPAAQPHIRHGRVEVAGRAFEGRSAGNERLLSFADVRFDAPVAASTLVIRAVLPSGELGVYGGGVVDSSGAIQQLFGRSRAKYRPIYADGEMRVYENTEALPRAFLVHRARMAPSLGAALGEMVHRPFDPRQEVVLAADSAPEITSGLLSALPGSDAAADGALGSAAIAEYSANHVRVHTSSPKDALLVLSDTYYPGWHASVDGVEQPLGRGDVLFRVVPVPSGEHDVDFRFEPASVRIGLLITAISLLCAAVALVIAGGWWRRGRTT